MPTKTRKKKRSTRRIERIDPTRTVTLRKRFAVELRRRFARLRADIVRLIAIDDVFGVKRRMIVRNDASWQFKTSSEQVKAFQEWLREKFGRHLSIKELMRRFAEEGYKRGIGRAFDDVEKPYAPMDFYTPSKLQFLKSAFGSPVGQERVEQLASRSFDDLKNITSDMSARMSRTLLEGLVDGSHPNEIAKLLSKDLDISQARAETIARTEIIRAHAEGQLDAMQRMGVAEVGVQVEWVTARDDAVCPKCEAMEGMVMDIEQAHNLLPMHPNCVTGDSILLCRDALAIMRVKYTGQIIEVVTAKGRRLTTTKNHMLLTDFGFVPAYLLCKGLNVIDAALFDPELSAPNNDRTVACVSDVFKSFLERSGMLTERVEPAAIDLHGDGRSCNTKIDIIWPDSKLRDSESRSIGYEEVQFKTSHLPYHGASLSATSAMAELFEGILLAADSSMGRCRESLAFLLGSLLHTSIHAFAAISGRETESPENTVYVASADPELLRDCVNAHPFLKQLRYLLSWDGNGCSFKVNEVPCFEELRLKLLVCEPKFFGNSRTSESICVQLDCIVDIKSDIVHDTYMYDVTSHRSFYSLNGIVSSNCRCAWLPAGAPLFPKTAEESALSGYGATIEDVVNVFCPTGEGGGVDPTCTVTAYQGSKSDWKGPYDDAKLATYAPASLGHFFTGSADKAKHFVSKGGYVREAELGGKLFSIPGEGKNLRDHLSQIQKLKKSKKYSGVEISNVLDGIMHDKLYIMFDPTAITTKSSTAHVANVFCPTGEGGGIDPTCGEGATGGGGGDSPSSDAAASANGMGRSGAKITAWGRAKEVIKSRSWSSDDVAVLAGAIPDATVNIQEAEDEKGVIQEGVLRVHITHVGYEAIRRIYDDHIVNDFIETDKTGSGLGTKIFSQQVAEAVKMGLNRIETKAVRNSKYNGYYTWARLGYDGKVPMGQHGGKKISELMKTPEGRAWWKEHGQSFDATFDLTEGSQSRRVLDAYNKERAARGTTANRGSAGAIGGGRSDTGRDLGQGGYHWIDGAVILDDILNVFCPTGEGGGVDPTCGDGATGGGGGGGGGGGSGSIRENPAAVSIMEKYKDEQAWHEPIKELMESVGLTLDDYKSANELYYRHNIASGGQVEKDIVDTWNSDTPTGRAMHAMADWNEWQAENVPYAKPSYDLEKVEKYAEKYRDNWETGKKYQQGGEVSPTYEDYLRLIRAESAGERVFYRKGPLDAQVISMTTDPKGARSGSSHFKPDRFMTYSDMKAAGYRLIAGARGMIGNTSAQEREHLWLKVKNTADRMATVENIFNVFCPTGEGGGVDPTCSPGGMPAASFPAEPDFVSSSTTVVASNKTAIAEMKSLATKGDLKGLKEHAGTPNLKVMAYKKELIDAYEKWQAEQPLVAELVDDEPQELTGTVVKSNMGGGSPTPPKLIQAPDGTMHVVKVSKDDKTLDHIRNEVDADNAYRAAGFDVPESKMGKWEGKDAKIAAYLDGAEELGEWEHSASASEVEAVYKEIAKGMAADALFTNWDAVGTGKNNIMIDKDGKPFRIDNGGAFKYRALGEPKKEWNDTVTLKSLQDPALNQNAYIYKSVTDTELHAQVQDLVSKKMDILKAVKDPQTRDMLEKRFNHMEYIAKSFAPDTTYHNGDKIGDLLKTKGDKAHTKLYMQKLAAMNPDGIKHGKLSVPISFYSPKPGSKEAALEKLKETTKWLSEKFPGVTVKAVEAYKTAKTLGIKKNYGGGDTFTATQATTAAQETATIPKHLEKYVPHVADGKATPDLPNGKDPALKSHKAHIATLSWPQKQAIASWKGGAKDIRIAISQGPMTQEAKDFLSALESAPKYEGVVYRGIDGKYAEEQAQQIIQAGIGGMWSDAAPHCMSPNVSTGAYFAEGKVLLRIITKTGRPIWKEDGYSSNGTSYISEKEVTGMPNTMYKIMGIAKGVKLTNPAVSHYPNVAHFITLMEV